MQTERQIPGAVPGPIAQPPLERPRITVGTLVGRTFSVWKRNLLRFAGVTIAIQVPSLLLGWAVGSPFLGSPAGPFSTPSPEVADFLFGPGWWTIVIAGMLLSLLHMGALTHGVVQHLAGRPASVRGMLAQGLRRIGGVLAAGVLAFLAFYLGLILLVVPGIFFGLMFSLTVPVVMAEPVGPVRALGRSRALTRGHRWALLGALLVTYLLVTGLGMAVLAVASAAPLLGTPLNLAANAAFGPLLYVLPAVAYHDIRVAKEGVDVAVLAKVFE